MGKKLHLFFSTNLPLILVLMVVFFLRIPSLFEPYWYGDEAITLTVGRAIRAGWILYQDIQDNKTPLLYYVAAISNTLWWFKFNLLWWHLLTIIGFWGLFGEFMKLEKKKHPLIFFKLNRIIATICFSILTTIPWWEGNLANGEIFMIGPTIYGMWLVISQIVNRQFTVIKSLLAGFLFAIAFLFKHPAATDFAVALLFLGFLLTSVSLPGVMQYLKQIRWILAGYLIPIAITIIYFQFQGALGDFINSVFSQNFSYLGSWSSGQPVHEVANVSSSGLSSRIMILFLYTAGLWWFRSKLPRTLQLALLWFVFALFGALLSGRPYSHYLLQVVPAISLLIGVISYIYRSWLQLTSVLMALGLLIGSWFYIGFWTYPVWTYYQNFYSFAVGTKNLESYYKNFDNSVIPLYQTADLVSPQLQPNQQIYMWGNEAAIYLVTNTLPGSKYIMAYHTVDFNGYERVMADLEKVEPRYIITTEEPFPELQQFLNKNYHLHEQFDSFTIYRQRKYFL